MSGILLGTYRPPLPAGVPGIDFSVGRTSTNPLNVASISNLPSGWTWAGPGNIVRMNSSSAVADWDFRGIDGFFGVQQPGIAISDCLFDLSAMTWSNSPFIKLQTNGYYSVQNCTFDGLNNTGNVNSCLSGPCILAEKNLIKNWPLDLIDISPLTARVNSNAYVANAGISLASAPNLNFFCTTPGTSAGSEPIAYATAIDGQAVTDGTAVFTASATTNKVRYNKIQSSSSMIGANHTDGMQIVDWARGAALEVYGNIIDIRDPINSTVTAPINIGGTIASDVTVRDNILLQNQNGFSMFPPAQADTVTGVFTYSNNYVETDNAGPIYSNAARNSNVKINGFKNYQTGAPLTFVFNDGSLHTVSSWP